MDEYIIPFMEALTVPHLFFISFVICIMCFGVPIIGLISRITAISKTGIEVKSDPNMQRKEKQPETEQELLVSFEKSPILSKIEQKIKSDLQEKKLSISGRTNKFLINLAAIHITIAHFEKTHNFIFGSQIFLLKKLNEMSDQGRPEEYIRAYFEQIKPSFPKELSAWTMEQYLGFLLEQSLIAKQNNTYRITDTGIEFLMWMTKNGRIEDKPF